MHDFLNLLRIFLFGKNNAGRALKMLEDKPALATIKNKYNETALHVFAPKPSAFASGRQPGILRSRMNSCELF